MCNYILVMLACNSRKCIFHRLSYLLIILPSLIAICILNNPLFLFWPTHHVQYFLFPEGGFVGLADSLRVLLSCFGGEIQLPDDDSAKAAGKVQENSERGLRFRTREAAFQNANATGTPLLRM